jgi:hypothetical protein
MNIAKAAVSVRISKPADASFAQLMNWLRIWLDMMKIQPARFRSFDDMNVEITFHSEHDASVFKAQFVWPVLTTQPDLARYFSSSNEH